MLILNKRPYITSTVSDLSGPTPTPVNFKWNSCHENNPINYEFQRRDAEVTNISAITNLTFLVVLNQPIIVPNTETVYINAPGYMKSFQVITCVTSPTDTQLTLSGSFNGNPPGAFVNINYVRKNYFIEISVRAWDNLSPSIIVELGTLRATPDVTGFCRVNIQDWLTKRMFIENKALYTSIFLPFHDSNQYVQFWISYREVYQGSTVATADDLDADSGAPAVFYVTNSVKQIQTEFGSNLKKYTMTSFDSDNKAKFISDFEEPTYFGPQFPFDIGVIFSEYVKGKLMLRREKPFNQGGSQTGVNDTQLIPLPWLGEFRIPLTGNYGATISKIKLSLVMNGIYQFRYVNQQYVADTYSSIIPPSVVGFTPYIGTEERTIRVKQVCYDNPLYIAWKGLDGAWNYWLFYYRQIDKLQHKIEQTAQKVNYDLESAQGIEEVIKKSGNNQMIIGATGLDQNDLNGIRKMLLSPKVQYFAGIRNGIPLWQNISFPSGTIQIFDNRNVTGDIEMNASFPEYNTLRQ